MSSIELCAGPSQVIVVTTAARVRALIYIVEYQSITRLSSMRVSI